MSTRILADVRRLSFQLASECVRSYRVELSSYRVVSPFAPAVFHDCDRIAAYGKCSRRWVVHVLVCFRLVLPPWCMLRALHRYRKTFYSNLGTKTFLKICTNIPSFLLITSGSPIWGGYEYKDKIDDVNSTTFIEIAKVALVHCSLVCSLWCSERYSVVFDYLFSKASRLFVIRLLLPSSSCYPRRRWLRCLYRHMLI
jgi:hypothetical protein